MKKINLMPMAGKGIRFIKVGIKQHKPLIKINNNHMFVEAGKSMPFANEWIYIYKNHYKTKINLKSILPTSQIKKSKVIYLSKSTQGQAATCLLASKYISPNDQIFIHPCDCFIKYKKSDYYNLIKKYDVIIFTIKPNLYNLNNIKSFGWVCGNKEKIISIKCKEKASNNPNKDYVIVGTFAFRKKTFFEYSILNLLKKNKRINNEFYMDSAIQEAIKLKFKVFNFVVEKHFSWGSPEELKIYQKKF